MQHSCHRPTSGRCGQLLRLPCRQFGFSVDSQHPIPGWQRDVRVTSHRGMWCNRTGDGCSISRACRMNRSCASSAVRWLLAVVVVGFISASSRGKTCRWDKSAGTCLSRWDGTPSKACCRHQPGHRDAAMRPRRLCRSHGDTDHRGGVPRRLRRGRPSCSRRRPYCGFSRPAVPPAAVPSLPATDATRHRS